MTARRTVTRAGVGRLALLVLGLLLLGWVVAGFDWRDIASRLGRPRPLPIAAVVATCLAYLWVRSYRWFLLVGDAARRAGFWPVHASNALAIALGNFAPLQAGEYAKVEWLARRSGTSRLELAGVFLLERVLDVVVLALFLATGVAMHLGQSAQATPWLWAGAGVAAAGLTAGALCARRLPARLRQVLAPLRELGQRPGRAAAAIGLTLVSWVLVIASWAALGHGFGIELRFDHALSLCASVTTIRVASCVPAGIGVDEAGIVGLMPLLGHSLGAAQAYALALRVLDLVIVLLALGFLPCVRTPRARTEP